MTKSFLNYCLAIATILLLTVELNNAFPCYVCKEKDNPTQCGTNLLLGPLPIQTIECATTCVTFKNKYDGGTIIRNCSAGLWVPPNGKADPPVAGVHDVETCIRDVYSLELFCFCQTSLCNGNNTGNEAVFAINECASNPCVNGTCVNLYGKYQCNCVGNFAAPNCATCKPGFTGKNCDIKLLDPCLSSPCKNGATCNQNVTTYFYNCTCPSGYYGVNCELDLNECASSPCLHGGRCTDNVDGFTCDCAGTGYEGTSCQTDIDECAGVNQCDTTGTAVCWNRPGTYKCNCTSGYAGVYCNENINDCAPNPCINGVCTDGVASYTCACYTGFTGTNCTDFVDFCAGGPCGANGVCRNDTINKKYVCDCLLGYTGTTCTVALDICDSYPCKYGDCTKVAGSYPQYTCTCYPGYTGKNCTVEINECASNPCKSGTCTDLLNNYKCTCLAGYTGRNCDVDIDECASSPCSFGTCNNLVNAYTCTCDAGYTGVQCTDDINECLSMPCLNFGTCVNLVNQFKCVCNTTYYSGTYCETPVLRCIQPAGVNPCNSNGVCQGGIGFQPITCKCFADYTGEFCETRISKCLGVTCQNGGVCVEDSKFANGFYCSCNQNFTGTYCETRISACATLRVNCNNGVCVDTGSDFVCDCDGGYTGRYCTDKYFTCTTVGTFPDPIDCSRFFYCNTNALGQLEITESQCSMLSTYQLLFDPIKLNCVLPGRHPDPGCYVAPIV